MGERKIKVTDLDVAGWPGLFICTPDADYPLDTFVPEADYLADEQDWQHVISRRGHADIGELTLAHYDGSQHVQPGLQWAATVWLLCDEDGEPVKQDVDE